MGEGGPGEVWLWPEGEATAHGVEENKECLGTARKYANDVGQGIGLNF